MKKSLAIVACLCFLPFPATFAQEPLKPLKWGADPNGGIPFVFADGKKFIGFEVDLAAALAREIGRPIEFETREFENLDADIERGDIDIAMNGLEITPARLARVRMTKPYYLYQLQLVVREDSPYKSLDDIKKADRVVGTLNSTAAAKLLDDLEIAKKGYDEQDGPYKDLSIGRGIVGVLLDLPAALYYAAPDANLKHSRQIPGLRFAGPAFAEGNYGIAVRRDNKELQETLNAAIDRLRDSGELKRILQAWELWNGDQYRLATAAKVAPAQSSTPFSVYFPLLLRGAKFTVYITFMGMALAMILGLPIALCRLYGPAPARWSAIVYIEFFRGIPVLLLLYFLYYGLQSIHPAWNLDPYDAAILGFGLNYAAYEAEIYRAGIGSIAAGQWDAAASLGMSPFLTFRRIILPQTMRVILPPMTNDFIALFKDTSIVSIIAITELSKQYQIQTKSGGSFLEIGLVTAALYLLMSVPLGFLSRHLESRWGFSHK